MPVNDDDAATHEVLAEELEGYDREAADAAADEWVAQSPVPTDGQNAAATFELYQDEACRWRWRLVGADGTVLADSDTGYLARDDAQTAVDAFKATIEDAPVVAADSR